MRTEHDSVGAYQETLPVVRAHEAIVDAEERPVACADARDVAHNVVRAEVAFRRDTGKGVMRATAQKEERRTKW